MKICSNCKLVVEDDAIFCQNCGSGGFEQSKPQKNFSQEQNFDFQQSANPAKPAVNAVKSLGSGSLFTTAVILFTVYTVLHLISNLIIDSSTISVDVLKDERFSNIKLNESFLSSINFYTLSMTLLSAISNLLICAGLWMFRKNCKDSKIFGIQTGGLRFLRISVIVAFIAKIVTFIITLIFIDALLHSIEFTDDFVTKYIKSAYIGSVMASATLVIGGAIAFYAFYYTKSLKMIKSVTDVVSTGDPSDYISMFVVVMNYIYAFFAFLNMFKNIFTFASQGSYAAFLIIMSVLIIKYRDQMRIIFYQKEYSGFNAANSSVFNA